MGARVTPPPAGIVRAVLTVRYDPATRSGIVRVREGKGVRTRRLSSQAVAEYNRRGEIVTIAIDDLDPTAAEFLRTADEETLMRVIAAQAPGKAGRPATDEPRRPRPKRPPRR
jgi:hypothetical protein